MKLAVVIIAQNEESNIAECIQSVFQSLKNCKDYQVLLVDSASQDSTVRIATAFSDLKIIELSKHSFLSPSVGRLVGTNHTQSEYIFFVDGDMIINEHWIDSALDYVKRNDKLAGIAGIVEELFIDAQGAIIGKMRDRFGNVTNRLDVQTLGGCALYRRSSICEVGGFYPYLIAEEELDLGLRLRKRGYLLQRLDVPMAAHHNRYHSSQSVSRLTTRQLYRNFVTGRFLSIGQLLRRSVQNKVIMNCIRSFKRHFLICLCSYSLIVVAIYGIACQHTMLLMLAAVVCLLFIMRVWHAKSFSDTLLYFFYHLLYSIGTLIGLLFGCQTRKIIIKNDDR